MKSRRATTEYNLPIVIEKDKDGYFAYCPELQGCYTQCKIYEEALDNIKDAITLNIEYRKSSKEDMPDLEAVSIRSHWRDFFWVRTKTDMSIQLTPAAKKLCDGLLIFVAIILGFVSALPSMFFGTVLTLLALGEHLTSDFWIALFGVCLQLGISLLLGFMLRKRNSWHFYRTCLIVYFLSALFSIILVATSVIDY